MGHDGARGACQTDEQSITQEDSYWPHGLGWLCLHLDRREIQGCPTQDVPLLQIRASKGQAHAHREASHLRGLRSRQGREPHRLQARAPPRQLESQVRSHCSFVSHRDGKKEDIEFEPVATSLPGHLGQQQQQNPTEQQQQQQHNTSEFELSLSLSPSLPLSLSLSLSSRDDGSQKISIYHFMFLCYILCLAHMLFFSFHYVRSYFSRYFFLTLRFVPQRERQHGIGQSKDFVENPLSVLGTHNTNIMGESACPVAQCFLSTPCFFRVNLYPVSTIFLSLALNNLVRIYFLSARLAQKIFR